MKHTMAFLNPFWLDSLESRGYAVSQLVARREMALAAWAARKRLYARLIFRTAPRCGAAAWGFLTGAMALSYRPGMELPALSLALCALALLRERREPEGADSQKAALLLAGFTEGEVRLMKPLGLALAALAGLLLSGGIALLAGDFSGSSALGAVEIGVLWMLSGLVFPKNRRIFP